MERTFLSASSIDFHALVQRLNKPLEEESELLDMLCDLADDHGSFISTPSSSQQANVDEKLIGSQNSKSSRLTVTTPLLDTISSCDSVEDLPFDDDSILGTQHSKASCDNLAKVGSTDPTSDSDEERETLEMSQIFDESEHVTDLFECKEVFLSL